MHLPSFHSFSWSRMSTSSLAAFRSICSSILARRAIALKRCKMVSLQVVPCLACLRASTGHPLISSPAQSWVTRPEESNQPWERTGRRCPRRDPTGHCRGIGRDVLWGHALARTADAAKQSRAQGPRKTVWGMATSEASSCWNTGSPLSNHLNPLMELPETPTVPSLLAKSPGCMLHRGTLFQVAEDTFSNDK